MRHNYTPYARTVYQIKSPDTMWYPTIAGLRWEAL